MYGVEPIFWLKLLLLIAVTIVALIIFNSLMRKWLRVSKKMFEIRTHLNKRHKLIDWTIRLTIILLLIVGAFINVEKDIWFLKPWSLLLCLIVLTEILQAYMERKYAKNKNDYLYTLTQLGFIVILVGSILTTDFFGLL